MFCITIDNPWVSNVIYKNLYAHKNKIGLRVVIDPQVPIDYYIPHFKILRRCSHWIMCCVCDSSAMALFTIDDYQKRVEEIHFKLDKYVDCYEVGNEVNGDWLGVGVSEKIHNAADYLKGMGADIAVTLYSDERNTWATWITHNQEIMLLTDLVLISEYPQDNNGHQVLFDQFKTIVQRHNPAALIGYGECGITGVSFIKKQQMMALYYRKKQTRYASLNSYFGGYFWWYQKDLIADTKTPLFKYFETLIK